MSCHRCDRRAVRTTVSGANTKLIGLHVARYQHANDLCGPMQSMWRVGKHSTCSRIPGCKACEYPAPCKTIGFRSKTQYLSILRGTVWLQFSSIKALFPKYAKLLSHTLSLLRATWKAQELRQDVPPHPASYGTPVVVDRPLRAVQVQLLTKLLALRHAS